VLRHLLDHIPGLVTAISSVTLLLSIIYNHYFFSVFDTDFMLQMSLSDHIVTGIYFLPAAFLGVAISFVFFSFFIPKGFTTEINNEKQRAEALEYYKKNRWKLKLFIYLFPLLLILIWFFFRPTYSPTLYFAVFLLFGSEIITSVCKKLSIQLHDSINLCFQFLVIGCFIAAMWGSSNATTLVENPKEVEITMRDGSKETHNYIRHINGSMLVFSSSTLTAISIDNIEKFSEQFETVDTRSSACRLFKFCLESK